MTYPVTRSELVRRLREARDSKGWSVRETGRQAGVAPSTVQGWFEGRHLPTPGLTENFLTMLTGLGLAADEEDRTKWRQHLAAMRGATGEEPSPYVGLRSYGVEDSDLYFGRERALNELVRDCTRAGRTGLITVIVIGDSGAGKSSLLAAGLMGRAMAPGGPLADLVPCWVQPGELPAFVAPAEPCLIIVDQFEEAQDLNEDEQRAIFDALANLPAHATVVVALTSDAFGFAMRDDRFASHLDTHVRVASLSETEYRRIIEEPAKRHGRRVSKALTRIIIQDMSLYGDPVPGTVLPLLSSVLHRCWNADLSPEISTDTYLAVGGLWAAVDDSAEAVYGALDADQRLLARRLLLSLVRVEGAEILRRRIPAATIGEEMAEVVQHFEAARLLTRRDGDLVIAHDALLRRWERLKTWVDEAAASLLIGRRIHMATQVWEEANRSAEALLPAEAGMWQEWSEREGAPLLSDPEQDFISASLEQAAAEEAGQRQTIRQLRSRQAVAVTAMVLAIVMATVAFISSARSDGFRREADAATRAAQARQIALVSRDIRFITPNIAAQLSVASLALDPSVEGRSAVAKVAGSPLPSRAVGPAGNTMTALLPDNGGIARANSAGDVSLWRDGNLATEPVTFASGGQQLFAIAPTQLGGRSLLFVGGQATASVWDVTDEPRRLGEFGADDVVYSATWQEETLLFGTLLGEIHRVDFRDPQAPRELPVITIGEEVSVTALAANRHLILAGGRDGRLEVFDSDGERIGVEQVPNLVLGLDVSPDGSQFVAALTGLRTQLWSATPSGLTAAGGWDLPGNANVARHGGDRVLVAGAFGEVRSYSLSGELLQVWPERTAVVSLDLERNLLLVGTTEGATSLWRTDDASPLVKTTDGRLFDVIRGGDVALIGSTFGGRPVIRDGNRWRELPLVTSGAEPEFNYMYGLSGDGEVLVNQTRDGRLLTFLRDRFAFSEIGDMALTDTLADLRVSPTGEHLALGYQGRSSYSLFKRSGGVWEKYGTVDGWPAGATFSGEEIFIAMGVDGKDFGIWDLTGEKPTRIVQVGTVDDEVPVAFAMSPGGALAVGDSAGKVSLYDLTHPASPRVTARLLDARSSISQLNFSDDGTRLLASTREGRVWVWRLDEAEPALDLQLTPDVAAVQGVAELEDWAIMTLSSGEAVAWPLTPVDTVDELCARFGMPLTEDEWKGLVRKVPYTDGCADS